MSVAHRTTSPAARVAITVDPTPAPPWTGVRFTCGTCSAEFQLEAADECKEIDRGEFLAPDCWTCGQVNAIQIEDHVEQIGAA